MGKNAELFARLKLQKIEKREAERERQAALIDSHRGDALVALDAWLQAGRPTLCWSEEDDVQKTARGLWDLHSISSLQDLALDDYKLRHPRARGERSFVFRGIDKSRTGVYVCRYCAACLSRDGELHVTGDWRCEFSAPVEVQQHLTECSLRSLAGQIVAVAPGAVTALR